MAERFGQAPCDMQRITAAQAALIAAALTEPTQQTKASGTRRLSKAEITELDRLHQEKHHD